MNWKTRGPFTRTRTQTRRRPKAVAPPQLERLETRCLLATFSFNAPFGNGADDFTLRLSDANANPVEIEIFDNNAQQVVASRNLAGTMLVEINGAPGEDDTLRIDFITNGPFMIRDGIVFNGGGGAGIDTLVVNADADMTLTDTALTTSFGTTVTPVGVEAITLNGGDGDNTIDASAYTLGGVTLSSGDGDDTLIGSPGDDTLIDNGDGDKYLNGGDGNDTYLVDPGSTITVVDSGGDDTIDVDDDADPVEATAMTDGGMITDDDGEVNIDGTMETYDLTDGDDVFNDMTDQPTVTVNGGEGDDTYNVDPGSTVTVVDSGGDDTIDVADDADPVEATAMTDGGMITDEDGEVIIEGTMETYDLTDGDDVFNDTTDQPTVTVDGGEGDDTYNLDPGSVVNVIDGNGFEQLTFVDPITVLLNQGIAFDDDGTVVLIGTFESVTGSPGDDVMVGTDGNEILISGGGNDLLDGLGGDDIYVLNTGVQTIVNDSAGNDTLDFHLGTTGITLNLSGTGGGFSNLDSTGGKLALEGEIENVIGTPFDDSIGGSDSDNILDGLAGNDVLKGGAGNDILLGRAGDDDLNGGSGRDMLVGGTGADRIVGSSSQDILIGGSLNFGPDEQDALDAIFAEWTSNRSFAERVANVTGENPGPDRLNGEFFFDETTLIDDDEVDVLTGSAHLDLFFIGLEDIVTDARNREEIIVLP